MSKSTPSESVAIAMPQLRQLWRIAWQTYQLRFDVILYANLLFAFPLHLLVDWFAPRELLATQDVSTIEGVSALLQQPEYIQYLALSMTVSILLHVVSTIVILGCLNAFVHKSSAPSAVLAESTQFYLRALALALLISVTAALGYMLFILPGLVVSAVGVLALPVMVWNNSGVLSSLSRAWKLMRPKVFTIVLYIILTEAVVTLIGGMVIISLPGVIGFSAVALTVSSVVASFTSVFAAVLFTTLQGIEEVGELMRAMPTEDLVEKHTDGSGDDKQEDGKKDN